MAQLGNSPHQKTVLQVEARKSFSLHLAFMDAHRRVADLTDCTVRLVVKSTPLDVTDVSDEDNLIVSSGAEIDEPTLGLCRFDIQAEELDHLPGDYPFVIVLTTSGGYSIVVVKGVWTMVQNPDFGSMSDTFTDEEATPQGLEITLRGTQTLEVMSTAFVPPGFTWMSDSDKSKIDDLTTAGSLLPPGGGTGQMLVKSSGADFDYRWAEPQSFDGTLSAEGQPAQYAPVANGDDTWAWQEVSTIVDWDAVEGQPGSILNKPELGTAAAEDTSAFAAAEHTHDGSDIASGEVSADFLPVVSALQGFSWGTDEPTGGQSGDFYLRLLD